MARSRTGSAVLTIRVPAKLERHLAREARRRRQTRSEVARAALQERFGDMDDPDEAGEARRQSLLVSRRRSERDALAFTLGAADLRDWK
jgi:predicted transcriptional regulator